MTGKLAEFTKTLTEKIKSKEADFKEYVKWLNFTSAEINTSILELLQIHSDQMDQLIRNGVRIETEQTMRSVELNQSDHSDQLIGNDVTFREASSDENNVELDWEGFDRDLAAVSNSLKNLANPQQDTQTTSEIKHQIKDLQKSNLELVRKLRIAEVKLGSIVERNEELEDCEELRKALKREQVNRLEAEQKLRDAQEEIKAAEFAYKVAKAVAKKIAAADDDVELIDRRDSAFQRKDVIEQTSHQDTYLSHQTSHQDTIKDTYPCDQTSHQDVNKDMSLCGEMSHQDATENANPFAETSHHEVINDTYLSIGTSHHDTNPFVSDFDVGQSLEVGFDSNPFLTPKPTDVTFATTDWNPFNSLPTNEESTQSLNPFLS